MGKLAIDFDTFYERLSEFLVWVIREWACNFINGTEKADLPSDHFTFVRTLLLYAPDTLNYLNDCLYDKADDDETKEDLQFILEPLCGQTPCSTLLFVMQAIQDTIAAVSTKNTIAFSVDETYLDELEQTAKHFFREEYKNKFLSAFEQTAKFCEHRGSKQHPYEKNPFSFNLHSF